jgi:alkaline phosphatase D
MNRQENYRLTFIFRSNFIAMRHHLFFLLIVPAFFACNRTAPSPEVAKEKPLFIGQTINTDQVLETIALGSCNRQDLPQDMWQHILEQRPQLWIWLGDNIYGDAEDMSVMKAKYMRQKYAPEYVAFREALPIIGTWDDHDFGVNDGGSDFPKKDESQALMLDFLDVPQDAPVRKQKGAYQSFTFGPDGKKVKVILLDSRYHRDEPIRNPNRPPSYLPNETGTILGEEQWQWLEAELENSDAQIHLIGNGIQVIPQDHDFEKWVNFPRERTRLFELLKEYQVPNPILLSGDRHIAEISRLEYPEYDTPIYEITTSGLTHSYDKVGEEPNRYRVSDLIGEKNFGIIKIDWDNPDGPEIDLEVRGKQQKLHTAVSLEK